MDQLQANPELEAEVDFQSLIRSSKSKHIEGWGDELGEYTLNASKPSSLSFDQYFYHLLLRDCPAFLASEYSNQYFYSRKTADLALYNKIRKLLIDSELNEGFRVGDYSILDSLPSTQLDSIQTILAPTLRAIGADCYLDTKMQINREKQYYIRVTYINIWTKEREYELHFYVDLLSSLITHKLVFRSKEILSEETRKKQLRLNDSLPPPPPVRIRQ